MASLSAAFFDARRRVGRIGLAAALAASRQLYVRRFLASVLLQMLAVMALFEAIFLSERFPSIFRDVLRNNADLFDTSLLFFLTGTQIFDLALAVAILLGVYWTILRMRESRELLVLFTAGIGPYQVTGLTLAIAVVALLGSLTVSGVIDPATRYAQRVILFDAKLRALRSGTSTGQFYFFPNRVAYVPATSATDAAPGGPRLFVFEPPESGTFRVVTADRARLEGPDASGKLRLNLGGYSSHDFVEAEPQASPCDGCPAPHGQPAGRPRMDIMASQVVHEMTIDELLPFAARGSEVPEMTIFEQLADPTGLSAEQHGKVMVLLGERLARGLLCLLAPLVALASVCLTSRRTNYLALPGSCMALMSLNVMSQWIVRATTPATPLGALALPALLTALFMALLVTLIVRRQSELIRPQLTRP
jgi:lipopolysaccharide export LptBFGC system permease protein LptF